MSGYVDNRCSQATVSEVEALIRERDEALAKLAALVEAIDVADKAGEEVSRIHRAWTASWNNRTREVPVDDSIADAATNAREAQRVAGEKFGPVDDSIADAATKAREAQRVAGEKFGAALRAARGEP